MSGRGSASKTILIRTSACVYKKDATRWFDLSMAATGAAYWLRAKTTQKSAVLAKHYAKYAYLSARVRYR
eukprot:scaffold121881_cov51-Phaeocystis_antarctica.AAC.2